MHAGNGSTVVTSELFSMPIGWKVVLLVLMIVVLVLTILGNLLVIAVLLKSDALSALVNSKLLLSLSAADILVGALVMPCALDTLRTGQWRCGAVWKEINAFGNFCFCIASIMHLMMLSIDRYFFVMRPLRYPQYMTGDKAVKMCALSWVYSAVWAVLPIVGVSSYECFIPYIGVCQEKDWSKYGLNFAFAISVVTGTYGVALVCMCFVHLKIAGIIRKQKQRIAQRHPHARITRTAILDKGVVTLLVVIMTYMLCWSPFCVLLFVEISTGEKVQGSAGMVTMLIGFANSCCNPLIYSVRYRKFRLAVRHILGKPNISSNSMTPSVNEWAISIPMELPRRNQRKARESFRGSSR